MLLSELDLNPVSVPGVSVLEKRHRQHFSKVRVWNTQWRGLVLLVWQKWMPHCAASFLLHQIWWSYRLKSGLSASKAVIYPLKFGLDGNKDVVLCWVLQISAWPGDTDKEAYCILKLDSTEFKTVQSGLNADFLCRWQKHNADTFISLLSGHLNISCYHK